MIKELTTSYLNSLDAEDFKKLLLQDIFTDRLNEDSSDFFIKLIEYIYPLMEDIDKDQLSKLAIAASSFYNYILFIDKVVDRGIDHFENDSYKNRVIEATSAIELSTIELYSLFKNNLQFWEKYRIYKTQYFEAIFEERAISSKKTIIDSISFERIAKGKHALAEFLVVSMFMLNKSELNTEHRKRQVLKCVQNIFIAMQIYDDIEDFAEDSENDIWTYPQSTLKELIDSENIVLTEKQEHLKLQLFYVSGTAEDLLRYGLKKLNESKNITTDLKLFQLESFIDGLIDKIGKKIELINTLINRAKLKQQK